MPVDGSPLAQGIVDARDEGHRTSPDIPALLRELYECRYEHCLPCADRVRMIESEVRRLQTLAGETP